MCIQADEGKRRWKNNKYKLDFCEIWRVCANRTLRCRKVRAGNSYPWVSQAGAGHNVLVNTVRGGFIDTPMHQKLGRSNLEKRIEMIPLKRAGKPQDVAGMVLFLSSGAGDFITGETFTVAGGD